ncbi:uncharacterized protein LOC117609441 [Osmia lignaria lignaria]|uniref:uncharacterized protein LOC117609441 n=1 Tax=Osmia lignaria lignaria TaxID=1437193 RepID=UPI00402B307A
MDIKKYTSIIQAVLKFVGFYPISMPRYLTCVSCIVLMIVTQIVTIYKNWNDLDTVLDISSSLLTIALAVLKSIIWVFNRKNLEYFVNFMLTSYWNIVKVDVFIHLQEYAIYAKYISKGYLVSMFNTLLFYSSLPIIEVLISKHQDSNNNFTMKNLPFTGAAPVAFVKFPFYQIIYIHQVLATNICALIMLATDALIASALLHTCGHFAVLKQQLKELDSYIYCITNSENNLKNIDTNMYNIKIQLMHVIQHHQIILWFCDNMEKNFHLMLFLQTITSSLIICFVGFQVSTVSITLTYFVS